VKLFSNVLIIFIKIYQLTISPYLGNNCIYQPTCSTYAIECFKNRSFFSALYLSIKRILRCHPFNNGGYDPVHKNKL
jgi:putative membrane protein insertion efficiency factor